MKNEIIRILLKKDRSITENLQLIGFWRNCNLQEFKYAWQLTNILK
jgi:hypothetical protein